MRAALGIVAGLLMSSAAACVHPQAEAGQERGRGSVLVPFDRPDGLDPPTAGVVENAVVRLDANTKVVRLVEGRIAIPVDAGADAGIERFVASTFKLPVVRGGATQLVLDRRTDTLTGRRITYQLHYANLEPAGLLPIPGSIVTIQTNQDNQITRASNDTVAILQPVLLRTAAGIDRAAAERAALRSVGADASAVVSAMQVVQVSRGTPLLLWRVNVLSKAPAGSYEVFVRADTGLVVANSNTAQYK